MTDEVNWKECAKRAIAALEELLHEHHDEAWMRDPPAGGAEMSLATHLAEELMEIKLDFYEKENAERCICDWENGEAHPNCTACLDQWRNERYGPDIHNVECQCNDCTGFVKRTSDY